MAVRVSAMRLAVTARMPVACPIPCGDVALSPVSPPIANWLTTGLGSAHTPIRHDPASCEKNLYLSVDDVRPVGAADTLPR